MRQICFAALCLGVLAGCGGGNEIVEAPAAPVQNIKQQIDTGNELKQTLKDTAKQRADEANKIIDEKLKR